MDDEGLILVKSECAKTNREGERDKKFAHEQNPCKRHKSSLFTISKILVQYTAKTSNGPTSTWRAASCAKILLFTVPVMDLKSGCNTTGIYVLTHVKRTKEQKVIMAKSVIQEKLMDILLS